ncbi:MAG TPA: low molecular weight protein-tyrosine-phosphatase [Steroidobacteraceae bacterium]|nr:low molecular weight protein-tyrosine-phosphatase [Steroidobacteraceae bacterium]
MKQQQVSVLFVCLGNICRSPTAEAVLRTLAAREAPGLPLRVDSAGTSNYHPGSPPDRRSQIAALRRGYDLSGLRARQVKRSDFEDFDLILAMDRSNLEDLLEAAPAGARPRIRLLLEYTDAGRLDVPDPYYGGPGGFDQVLDLIEAAARGLLRQLLAEFNVQS